MLFMHFWKLLPFLLSLSHGCGILSLRGPGLSLIIAFSFWTDSCYSREMVALQRAWNWWEENETVAWIWAVSFPFGQKKKKKRKSTLKHFVWQWGLCLVPVVWAWLPPACPFSLPGSWEDAAAVAAGVPEDQTSLMRVFYFPFSFSLPVFQEHFS